MNHLRPRCPDPLVILRRTHVLSRPVHSPSLDVCWRVTKYMTRRRWNKLFTIETTDSLSEEWRHVSNWLQENQIEARCHPGVQGLRWRQRQHHSTWRAHTHTCTTRTHTSSVSVFVHERLHQLQIHSSEWALTSVFSVWTNVNFFVSLH